MSQLTFRKWLTGAATLAAVGLASLSHVQAQNTVFGTGFDNYPNGSTLSGQPNNGGTGSWDTNDAYAGTTTTGKEIGQSDYVGFIQTYSASTTDYWGALGGLQRNANAATGFPGVVPGASTVYLGRQFTVPGGSPYLNFDVDFAIPQSSAANGSAANDTFAWTFQSGAISSPLNLFSASFVPDATTIDPVTGRLTFALHYKVGNGAEMTTTRGVLSSSVYHLKISVNIPNNSFSILLTPSDNSGSFGVNNISLSGLDPRTIDLISATWNLSAASQAGRDANGGYVNAGSNALIFNNYLITVPEPSTWAMAGLGLAGLAVLAYRRRVRA